MSLHRTVLLVEPNDDNRNMYREYLRQHGLTVLTALQFDEALKRSARADVIVTSIRLPGPYDGIELVRRLRRSGQTADRFIIVLTGDAFVHHRQLAFAEGCDRFLAKPCLPQDLEAVILKLLGHCRARKPGSLLTARAAIKQR